MEPLSTYKQATMNWREQLRKNRRNTRWVMALFISLYCIMGLLIDLMLYSTYNVSLWRVLEGILTFELFPYATLTALAAAGLGIWITVMFQNKIMLLGTEYYEITPDTARSLQEKQLFHVVEEMKVAAALAYMPRVFIIEAGYMNAFASGYTEKSAMVAITRGLLEKLDRSELQAVMAHELSHIRHLDIKLTLTVAVLSNLILIILDLLFYRILYTRRGRSTDPKLMLIIIVIRFIFPLITVLLTLFLSRTREYMADAGCVELMRDNKPLANALIKIHQDHRQHAAYYQEAYQHTGHEELRRAAYLYDPKRAGFSTSKGLSALFSTHPSLEQRLNALGFKKSE